MGFLDRILPCHQHDPAHFRPFVVERTIVGWMKHEFAKALAGETAAFEVAERYVEMPESLSTPEARTEAAAEALARLRERGDLPAEWGERLPVVRGWGEAPLLLLDRGAVPRFGVRAFGLHVNGVVRAADGLRLWVGRRSASARTAPGALDHLVAGGQPHGLSLRENLAKEAWEEASVPPDLAARAVPVGAFAYRMETPAGLRNDTLFLFDLEVPASFVPRNRDGEVEAFDLWPVERVRDVVRDTEAFKFNVAPALVDFFVRHGVLSPEEPGYLEVVRALRA